MYRYLRSFSTFRVFHYQFFISTFVGVMETAKLFVKDPTNFNEQIREGWGITPSDCRTHLIYCHVEVTVYQG